MWTSRRINDALGLLGAHPVSMPISELHSALDKRVIDSMLSPTTAIHDFKLYDQIRYGTRINMFSSLLMVVMDVELSRHSAAKCAEFLYI